MAFFVDWELWAKMCFVLVLIYGTGVHIYNSLRLKKFSAEATTTAAAVRSPEKLEMGEDDIPFGSRAIERGIKIEGIWISNHNTPVGSPIWGTTPDTSRPPSLGSKSTLTFPLPPLPSKEGSDFLSPKAATFSRCKSASVSSPLPYPKFYKNANTSSSGINDRRAKSEFFSRNERESESGSRIPQSDNGYSEFEFGELGGVESSDQQQESGYSSINSRTAENGSSTYRNEESDFTPIATASENNIHLHDRSAGSGVLECVSGQGQYRSASGPPYEQAHLNPIENCRTIDNQNLSDLLSLHSHRRFSIAETGQLGNAARCEVAEIDRDHEKEDHAYAVVTHLSEPAAALVA
ncbi:hypothetical protein AJ78_01172 [Emergomyces pasteurianus Ep9510]|uniref:Uncharacterized protein n=1 Tax=Emergomyces pasteurianus Ep9510 TaxID=1447872 RepID=A0A1J9QRM3_9EURO|nr:hypothetical protein AJ78_01172 [Emergomyces pasteurianus Ep9510]